jgi:hypothetical protein
MRLVFLTVMAAAVAAVVAIAASGPATAARSCSCLSILSSGFCTEYGHCHDLEASVPTFKPVRSAKQCRHSQTLLCDNDTCKVVCDPSKK